MSHPIRSKHWTTEPSDSLEIVLQKTGFGAIAPKTVIQVLAPYLDILTVL